MAISSRLLHRIRQLIADAHSAFVVNYISPNAVPPDTLERLRRLGMVRPRIRSLDQAYQLGRLIQVAAAKQEEQQAKKPQGTGGLRVGGKAGIGTPVLKDAQGKQITLQSLQGTLARDPIPLTQVERNALDVQATKTAQYIVGLGNRVEQKTSNILIEVDQKLDRAYRQTVQNAVQRNIARRETVQRLRSDLGFAAGDWSRDLDRIAFQEKQTALQLGFGESARQKYGDDARVAKLVSPSACEWCRKAYLDDAGNPKVFKLSELAAVGGQLGVKISQKKPSLVPLHVNCACGVISVPENATPLANGRFLYANTPSMTSGQLERPRLKLFT